MEDAELQELIAHFVACLFFLRRRREPAQNESPLRDLCFSNWLLLIIHGLHHQVTRAKTKQQRKSRRHVKQETKPTTANRCGVSEASVLLF